MAVAVYGRLSGEANQELVQRPRQLIGLTIALIYGVVMALPNLVPNEALTAGLRLVHTVEVFVGNFLFGWVVDGCLPGQSVKLRHIRLSYRLGVDLFKEDWTTLFKLLEEGKIKPILASKYPLLEAVKFYQLLESGQVSGNLVLLAPEFSYGH